MAKGPTLEALRARIDKIDAKLHALLVERADVSLAIATAKRLTAGPSGAPVRPSREAAMIRALAERHEGPLPLASLLAIWREIIGASAAIQMPLSIALSPGVSPVAAFEAARSLYGVAAPITQVDGPRQALRALTSGSANLAILPEPGGEPGGDWWPALMEGGFDARIIQGLPLVEPIDWRGERFVVVAQAPYEPSVADRTWLSLTARAQLSAANLAERLAEVGLIGQRVALSKDERGAHHLIALESHLHDDDPRLDDLATRANLAREAIRVLGGRPLPLMLELAS